MGENSRLCLGGNVNKGPPLLASAGVRYPQAILSVRDGEEDIMRIDREVQTSLTTYLRWQNPKRIVKHSLQVKIVGLVFVV
mgnify:CR=1 FL=1